MSRAEHIVENLLDDEAEAGPDPKAMAADIKAQEDAEATQLKNSGIVSPKTVTSGGMIYHREAKNADGSAARARVTSVKTWVTRPNDFVIGWKHGKYEYGKITPHNASEWTTVEPPRGPKPKRHY